MPIWWKKPNTGFRDLLLRKSPENPKELRASDPVPTAARESYLLISPYSDMLRPRYGLLITGEVCTHKPSTTRSVVTM